MAITVHDKWGRRLSTNSGERGYVLLSDDGSSEDTDADAYNALGAFAPTSFEGLPRSSYEVHEIDAGSAWIGVAHYSQGAGSELVVDDPSTATLTFDTAGGTQRITQSVSTVLSSAPSGLNAPDFKGAIGVTKNGVEGVDIFTPAFQFTETHQLSASVVTTAYIGDLFLLTSRVNDAPFKGFAAGEVLFLGAQGSKRTSSVYEITYRFACSPNLDSIVIGDIDGGSSGISKKGWEYLWVLYEDEEDSVANFLVRVPRAAYVEQVYRDGNFSLLNIT